MAKTLFRIKSVAIQGFKGFTNRQSFELDGRHVFFFGDNGLGKSSVVEAIRWCLFGLASRQGETIKNQFYGGPCIVELSLQAPDGTWSFQRRLSESGGIGPSTVRDPGGTIRNLEDVFPQLSRIGPMEGAHVIYAAQQPSNRRPEADITDFGYVVFRYLGIEDVPRLTDLFVELGIRWKDEEDELLGRVDELGAALSGQISEVEIDIERITSDPPWGATVTPTFARTREKVDDLASEAVGLGADCSGDTLDGLTPGQKLTRILAAVNAVLSGDLQELQQKLSKVSILLLEINALRTECEKAAQEVKDKDNELAVVSDKLAAALEGDTVERLSTNLEDIDRTFGKAKASLDVVSSSLRYLGNVESRGSDSACPACRQSIQPEEFEQHLKESELTWDSETKDSLAQSAQLQERISTALEMGKREGELRTAIGDAEADLEVTTLKACKLLNLAPEASVETIDKATQEVEVNRSGLQAAVESQRASEQAWLVRTNKLREELRFHRLRTRSQELKSLYDTRYQALQDDVKEWTSLRDTVGSLRKEVKNQLDSCLEAELPPVAATMTEVYLRLTGKPTFDTISIHQGEKSDGKIALELKVSSKRGPGAWPVDEGVLNGQALNAIQLVPYLVFSRYQEDPLLDLLLLDDPTQAFDSGKIELLLKELSETASHATLLVATHEEHRFLPIVQQLFAADEVKVLRAVDLDDDGPRFEDVPTSV